MSKHWLLLFLLLVGFVGCGRRGAHTAHYLAALDAEKRNLEDIIYLHQAENKELVERLETCRTKLRELGGGDGSAGDSKATDAAPGPDIDVPDIDVPGIDAPGLDFGVEMGSEVAPSDVTPPAPDVTDDVPSTGPPLNNSSTPIVDPPPNRGVLPPPNQRSSNRRSAGLEPTLLRGVDAKISHIVLNRLQTNAADFDQRDGDDGFQVVIEPRNAKEVYLPASGKISVVVLDPQLSGDEARFARWEFGPDEVQRGIRDTRTDKGIYLKMKWPGGKPPQHSNLRMYVRFQLEDGTHYEDDREIFVHLPRLATNWTRRSSQSVSTIATQPKPQERLTETSQEESTRTSQLPKWGPTRPAQ